MWKRTLVALALLSPLSFTLAQSGNQSDRGAVAKGFYDAASRAREAPNLILAESLVITELRGAAVTVSGAQNDVLVITSPNFNQQAASQFFSGYSSQTNGSRFSRIGFTSVRITNGQQTWEASPTQSGFSKLMETRTQAGVATPIDKLGGAEIKPEDCCSTLQQEKEYCKAWAAGTGNAKIWYSHTWQGSPGYCPNFLISLHDEAALYGRNDTQGITEEEKQKAEAAIAEDARQTAARNFLNLHRCDAQDPRPASERDSDPICMARKQEEIEQRKRVERERQEAELRQKEHDQAVSRIDIHLGEPQARVKARLATVGFDMPWQCAGDWSQNVGVSISGNWEWIAGCSTQRLRKDGGTDNIKVYFSVYRRVRYLDPDTGAGSIVNQKTDKLVLINYNGK